MRTLSILAAALVAATLAGCATGYQPQGLAGGFSHTQYAPDEFAVRFNGNGYTSMDRARDMALLRTSELVLEAGFRYFTYYDGSSTQDASFVTGGYSSSSYTVSRGHVYGSSYYVPPQVVNVSKPLAEFRVKAFHERPTRPGAGAYDALFVCQSLSAKFQRQCPVTAQATAPQTVQGTE